LRAGGATDWVPWLGAVFALAYLAASFGLIGSFAESAPVPRAPVTALLPSSFGREKRYANG
jgi:hypothetical protein